MPTLLNFQNDLEWQRWRSTGLGASDAPIIQRRSRFMTPFELYLIKTGLKKPSTETAAMRHGKQLEAKARDAYTVHTGNFMPPANVERGDWLGDRWLHASLDGYDQDNDLILEVKCPWDVGSFLTAKEGSVPEEYWDQVQHAMAVAEVNKCHFWCYFGDEGVLVEATFDQAYWVNELFPAEQQFWSWCQEKNFPLPAGVQDRSQDAEWLAIEKDVYNALAMRQVAEERLRAAKAKLEKIATSEVTKGALLEAIWNYRKGGTVPSHTRAPSLTMTIRRIR